MLVVAVSNPETYKNDSKKVANNKQILIQKS